MEKNLVCEHCHKVYRPSKEAQLYCSRECARAIFMKKKDGLFREGKRDETSCKIKNNQ